MGPTRDAQRLLLIRSPENDRSVIRCVRKSKETHVDATGTKARLAVAEVVLPQTAERFVVAEPGDGRPGGVDAAAPCGQRARVAGTERSGRLQREPGALGMRRHRAH